MELKHITRAEWVAALRSGKYTQGQGTLKADGDGAPLFCCLGVACDLAGVDWDSISPADRGVSTFSVYAEKGVPYPALALFRDLGMTEMETCDLAVHNDRGDSFEAIADQIEALPVYAFDPDWLERHFPDATEANLKATLYAS